MTWSGQMRRRMCRSLVAIAAIMAAGFITSQAMAQSKAGDKLRVYFIDVEGGQSTLFVTPEGQ